jgi:ferritin-like metal-binding protein YciE
MENNNSFIPIISVKKIEKNVSKTYTDTESNIKALEKISEVTHRSFNDVLKEIVNNFIQNGQIYEPDKNEYYNVKEIIDKRMENDNAK